MRSINTFDRQVDRSNIMERSIQEAPRNNETPAVAQTAVKLCFAEFVERVELLLARERAFECQKLRGRCSKSPV
jgi:hypothetical protein